MIIYLPCFDISPVLVDIPLNLSNQDLFIWQVYLSISFAIDTFTNQILISLNLALGAIFSPHYSDPFINSHFETICMTCGCTDYCTLQSVVIYDNVTLIPLVLQLGLRIGPIQLISLRLRFRRNFLSVLHLNLVSSPIKVL